MTFKLMHFASAADLQDFVIDQGIIPNDITSIVHRDGRWWLFYWA